MRRLWLLFFLLALGSARAAELAISAEAKECFDWFATLGFPDVKDATFGEARYSNSFEFGIEPSTVTTIRGYLLPKQGNSSTMVKPDLIQWKLTLNDESVKPELRVQFEERPFVEHARQQLELLRHPPKNGRDPFNIRLGHKAEVFFLAYASWRKGEDGLAQSLFDEAVKLRSEARGTSGYKQGPMREELERELGHQAMWDAVLQVGGGALGINEWGGPQKLVPRTKLLENFQDLIRRYPACAYVERAKSMASMFERMIAEDKQHPVITDEALAKLPLKEQVAELIFQLRDQQGRQISQPGWCQVCEMFDQSKPATTPADRLRQIGYPAVPQLIEALSDDRFSRAVGFGRDFHFSHEVLSIGECASQILNRITDQQFGVSVLTTTKEAAGAAQKKAREWWVKFQVTGEEQTLVDEIASGGREPFGLVQKLKAKYPDAVAGALIAGGAKAGSAHVSSYTRLIGEIDSEEARYFLRDQLKNGKTVLSRVEAAGQLSKHGWPEVLPAVLQEWQQFPQKRGHNTHSDGFDILVDLLCASGDVTAIQALVAGWDAREVPERFRIVTKLGQWFSPQKDDNWPLHLKVKIPEPAARAAALALLAHALDDTGVYAGTSGTSGDFVYSDPRICDFALRELHLIDPKGYAFSNKAGRRQRDAERMTAANLWRLANDKPLLPVPVSLPVLPPDQVLKITTIEITPADTDPQVRAKLEKLKGAFFTPKTLPDALLWFASGEVTGLRGLKLDARRENDQRGVLLSAEVVPAAAQPSKQRNWEAYTFWGVEDHSHGSNGGSFLPMSKEMEAYFKDFEAEVEKTLKLPLDTSVHFHAELSHE